MYFLHYYIGNTRKTFFVFWKIFAGTEIKENISSKILEVDNKTQTVGLRYLSL